MSVAIAAAAWAVIQMGRDNPFEKKRRSYEEEDAKEKTGRQKCELATSENRQEEE